MTVREMVERLGLDTSADEVLVARLLDSENSFIELVPVVGVFVDEERGRVLLVPRAPRESVEVDLHPDDEESPWTEV